jgi:hypothetical protein
MDEIRLEKQLTVGGDVLVAQQKGEDKVKETLVKALVTPPPSNGKSEPSVVKKK